MFIKLENGEIVCKEIINELDIDDELVGHPDSMYNVPDQMERLKWLLQQKDNMEKPIMEVGTACGYILNKICGEEGNGIGIDIRPDRLLVAKRKYGDKGNGDKRMKFCYANVLNLEPFYNMGIKTIIATEIFEHIQYHFVHYAIIHCLRTAPTIYYTVPNSKKDSGINYEHKWSPTFDNINKLLDYVSKYFDGEKITYDIREVCNFYCGTIKRFVR